MLLDTSGLFALVDRHESRHAEASLLYRTATLRLTHSYVLAEFVPLCLSGGLSRVAALRFCRQILEGADITIIWVNAALHESALALLEGRRDKSYSLCDAVSFVIMRRRNLTEALTADRHFEQEGFRWLLG
jgi:predicted nucleic acid-binding protein